MDTVGYAGLARELYSAADGLLDGLVSLRVERGLSCEVLADRMGVTVGMVEGVEAGRVPLTLGLLVDYALEVGARVSFVVEPVEVAG